MKLGPIQIRTFFVRKYDDVIDTTDLLGVDVLDLLLEDSKINFLLSFVDELFSVQVFGLWTVESNAIKPREKSKILVLKKNTLI